MQNFEGFVGLPISTPSVSPGNYYTQTGFPNLTLCGGGCSSDVLTDGLTPPNQFGRMLAAGTGGGGGLLLETIFLPLNNPIQPNCTATVTFQANSFSALGGNIRLQFFALNGSPTGPNDPLTATQTPPLPCASTFVFPSGVLATAMLSNCGYDIPNTMTADLSPSLPVVFNDDTDCSFTWVNTTGSPITALWIVPGMVSGFGTDVCDICIDDIAVHNDCLSKLSISGPNTVVVCPGQTAKITYSICADPCLDNATTFSLQASLPNPVPNGVYFVAGSFFNSSGNATVTLNPGQCKELILGVVNGNGNFVSTDFFDVSIGFSGLNSGLYCTNSLTTHVITDNLPTCCQMSNVYFMNGSFDYTAPVGTDTWQPWYNPLGTPANINGTVTIPAGANITIKDYTMQFGHKGRILVQPGGVLTIKNSTLTGDPGCLTMWQGIRVYKNSDGLKGVLNLEDFDEPSASTTTTIRDALIGVADGNLPVLDLANISTTLSTLPDFNNANNLGQIIFNFSSSAILNSYGGSITTPVRTNFENCFIGMSNHLNTQMDIGKCSFTTTSPNLYYPFGMLTQGEAGIEGILGEGFYVRTCYFNNLKYGIRTNIIGDLTVTHSGFDNCRKGVSCRNMFVKPENDVKITLGNEFKNCITAIQCQSVNAKIEGNNISNSQYGGQPNGSFVDNQGILLMGSDFIVKNNQINNTTRGMTIVSSYKDAPIVHGNVIENTTLAIATVGMNKNLIIECNDIVNYSNGAISLAPWFGTAQTGILANQGFCDSDFPAFSMPAANKFVRPNNTSNLVLGDIFSILSYPYVYSEFSDQLPSGFSFSSGSTQVLFQSCAITTPSEYNRDARCAATEPMIAAGEVQNLTDDDLKDQMLSKWLKYYSEQGDKAALESILNSINSDMAYRSKIQHYFYDWTSSELNQFLDMIPKTEDEDNNFDYFYKLLLQLREENRSLFEISEEEESILLQIATSHTATAYRAQSLLYVARGYEFNIDLPDIIRSQQTLQTSFKTNTSANSRSNCLYPNPSTGQVALNYDLINTDNEPEKGILHIYNNSGAFVCAYSMEGKGVLYLENQSFSPGLYFYDIITQTRVITHDKLLIIK